MANLKISPFNEHRNAVGVAWKDAIAGAKSPMGHAGYCDPKCVSKFEEPGNENSGVASSRLFSVALHLKALDVSDQYAAKYLALSLDYGPKALALGPQHLGFKESDDPRYFTLKSFEPAFAHAMAQSMSTLQVPDRAFLRGWVQRVADSGKKRPRRSPSDWENGWLLVAALCAVLAHDLPLAKQVQALSRSHLSHPTQTLAFKTLLAGAEEHIQDGVTFVRIEQAQAVDAFFQLYNLYRWPNEPFFYAALYPEGRPSLFEATIFDGTLPGNFLLTWIYLQCVNSERQDSTDWDILKYLMRS